VRCGRSPRYCNREQLPEDATVLQERMGRPGRRMIRESGNLPWAPRPIFGWKIGWFFFARHRRENLHETAGETLRRRLYVQTNNQHLSDRIIFVFPSLFARFSKFRGQATRKAETSPSQSSRHGQSCRDVLKGGGKFGDHDNPRRSRKNRKIQGARCA